MPEESELDDNLESRVAIARHPVHAMLVTFPVAFLMSLVASDLAFLYTQDPFWARASLWLAGGGAMMGLVAGIVGTIELLIIPGVRRRGASWSHFVAAIMLISVAVFNWFVRLADPAGMILPWGLMLTALGALLVVVAGWLGANLVFDHKIGIVDEDGD